MHSIIPWYMLLSCLKKKKKLESLIFLLLLLLFNDSFTIARFVCCFLLVGMSAVLELYLYQKETNIFCHSPALPGYSLTAKSLGKQTEASGISSKASGGFAAQLCLPTESQLGLPWVRWGWGDLSLLLPGPATLEHVVRELLSRKQVVCQVLAIASLLRACS